MPQTSLLLYKISSCYPGGALKSDGLNRPIFISNPSKRRIKRRYIAYHKESTEVWLF